METARRTRRMRGMLAPDLSALLAVLLFVCGCGSSEPESTASPKPEAAGKPAADVEKPPERKLLSPKDFRPHRFAKLAGLPEAPPVPPDNPITPAKVELGRHLFFDTRLSGDTTFSCASCHDPTRGWGDGNEISTGYPGTRHWRNSQTVINSAYLMKLFWAGEAVSLEAQAKSAATGNLAGNVDPAMAEERLVQIPEYVRLFKKAFGVNRPTFPLALRAIATFERAEVNSTDSPFDRYMRGETSALSQAAIRGWRLFEGAARCIKCHNGPLFTDENYHNLGVPKNPFFEQDVYAQIALRYQHYTRGVPETVYRTADRDLGLYYTTKREEDKGKFRTPPLRYLTYTAPYMHNGIFLVLEEVIDFYDQGGGEDPNKSALLRPLRLTNEEKVDLLAFLESLSGSEVIIERPAPLPYQPIELANSEAPQ